MDPLLGWLLAFTAAFVVIKLGANVSAGVRREHQTKIAALVDDLAREAAARAFQRLMLSELDFSVQTFEALYVDACMKELEILAAQRQLILKNHERIRTVFRQMLHSLVAHVTAAGAKDEG